MTAPVIEIENLWFSFNRHPILKKVNLTIYEKEFLAVIGPNGGGKTTLVKIILGLLKPQRGSVRVFGKPPCKVSLKMGYVPQRIDFNRNFPVTVADIVHMGRLRTSRRRTRRSSDDEKAVQRVLEKLDMWEFRDYRIGELSGGQRQRVFIARALVTEPDLLFLDEPTSSIDTRGQSELYEMLDELNQHITIVVVSHDIMLISSHVKSVACVNQQVHFHEAAEITEDMLEKAYHCPIDLIAHGIPHRVLKMHEDD